MTANAGEFCWDFFDPDYYKTFKDKVAENPKGPAIGIGKGHTVRSSPYYHKNTVRVPPIKSYELFNGFRIARSVTH